MLISHIRSAAETLQRSLLPRLSPRHPGLEVAARYLRAQAFSEVGGDRYDIIPLGDDVYAIYDPHRARLQVASAGHLPPVLTRPGRSPELPDLPTGTPLGVGGVRLFIKLLPTGRRPGGGPP